MAKPNHRQIREDRITLARSFPTIFTAPRSKAQKRPLKIGIFQDLLARGVTDADGNPLPKTRIRRALEDYIRGYRYQKACAAGGTRIDLDGNPAGTVTQEQQKGHAGRAEKIRQVMAQRKASRRSLEAATAQLVPAE